MAWSNLFTLLLSALFFYVGIDKLYRLIRPRRAADGSLPASHPSQFLDPQLRFRAFLAQALLVAFFLLFGFNFAVYLIPLPSNWVPNSFVTMAVGSLCGLVGFVLGRGLNSTAPPRKDEFEMQYTDLTSNPPLQRTALLTEIPEALARLGFNRVCLLEAATQNKELSEVYEVFASRDLNAFAEPEVFFGYETAAFRTRVSNGAIVETTLLNVQHKHGGIRRWFDRRFTALRWPRKNRPRANYSVMLVFDSTPEHVWGQHTARVAHLVRAHSVSVPPHDSFPTYVTLSRQAFEIARLGIVADLSAVFVLVPSMVVLGTLLWFTLTRSAVFGVSVWNPLLLAPLALISGFIAVWLARQLSLSQLREVGRLFDVLRT